MSGDNEPGHDGDEPDDNDGDDDAPATRGELRGLMQRLDSLAEAQDDLREARGPAEKREARADVGEAEDAFTRAAREAGLDPKEVRAAIAKAKSEAAYGDFRKMMDRYIADLPSDEPKQKGPSKAKKTQTGANGAASSSSASPGPDTEPVREHWSNRRLSDLLR